MTDESWEATERRQRAEVLEWLVGSRNARMAHERAAREATTKREELVEAIQYLSKRQGELNFAVDTTPEGDKPYVFACVICKDGAAAGTVTPVYLEGDAVGAVIRAVAEVRKMVESDEGPETAEGANE